MGLGRGLSSILADIESGYLTEIPHSSIQEIEIDKIELNPYQPRFTFKEKSIKELALSIKRYGLIQPVVVIKNKDKFILVAGERRLRACKLLKNRHIKAIIMNYSIEELKEYSLIENIQRENLNAIEIALSLEKLIKEYNYTHEEMAKIINKSRTYVTNMLRILNLPEFVKKKLKEDKLTFGHAKILVGLNEKELKVIVEKIEKEKLSVRETEYLIKSLKNKLVENRLNKIIEFLEKNGLKVHRSLRYIKILFKNENDLVKLEKLLEKIS